MNPKKNPNKLVKKHQLHMTLIELLIALALATLAISVLSYFYRDLDWINHAIENEQKNSFKKMYVENRLAKVLPKAVAAKDPAKDFYFYTSPYVPFPIKAGTSSLVFTYENGIDLSKDFSNHVLGRLYLDQQGNLSLASWPSPKRWDEKETVPIKQEVLMEGVDNISFEFYAPPENGAKKNDQNEKAPPNSWLKEWKKEYQELPAIVKMTVTKTVDNKPQTMVFAFPLPNSNTTISYEY